MQDPIDFFRANSALALASPIASSPISGRTVETRSRVPSCGRRYADAPTAVLFTACGGRKFPSSYRDNRPLVRTHAGLRFVRRSSSERRCAEINETGMVCKAVALPIWWRNSPSLSVARSTGSPTQFPLWNGAPR